MKLKFSGKRQSVLLGAQLCVALGLAGALWGADLWVDHDPYSPFTGLRGGVILKLHIDEPVLIEYEYSMQDDDKAVVKMVPDKKISEVLPPADINKSIQTTKKLKIEAKSRLKMKMAVTVRSVQGDGVVEFQGTKVLAYENGKGRQQFQIFGRVNRDDINSKRIIKSNDVADLQVTITGAPIKINKNFPMKTLPGLNPGDPPRPSAELSDAEKQRLLLEYLNRILGETSDN